ncbi:MAG: integrase core domain-containing protein [Holophagaceae bacterium]
MSQTQSLLSSEQKFQRRIEVVRVAKAQGPQQALIKFGIPLRTIGSWVSRFNASGIEGLKDKSRAPHFVANKKDRNGLLGAELERIHRSEPGLNRMQIFSKLFLIASDEAPTLSWIARESRRRGLTRQPKIRKNEHKTRYEIKTPGFLQVDTKFVEKDGEPGEKIYQFTAIDECTRVRFLGGSLTKGAKAAAQFLERAIEFYKGLGVTVYQVQTDRGTEFTIPQTEVTLAAYARGETEDSEFTQVCRQHGIRHRLIRPRTPELNGKVERSHRIDGERFYSRYKFADEHALNDALQRFWMPEYNEMRPHGALGYLTPMEFLRKRQKELQNFPLVESFLNKNDASSEEREAA